MGIPATLSVWMPGSTPETLKIESAALFARTVWLFSPLIDHALAGSYLHGIRANQSTE